MTAGEYCIREVIVVGKNCTVVEAARLMRDHHVGDLIVTEATESGERVPVGILTDRDIVVEVVAKASDYTPSLAAGDIMSTDLMMDREEESLSDTLKKMCTHGIRRIPVVDESGCLKGILSIDDIIAQVCEQMTDITKLIDRQQKREKEEKA